MQSIVIMDDKFCVRLRRERERLGLTQKEFAQKAGISRMSQVNYESGKRYPGEDYLEAIKSIGVDDLYLISGYRLNELSNEAFAARILLYEIAESLGLERGVFNGALEELTHLAPASLDQDDSYIMDVPAAGYVADVLSRSSRIVEADLLAEVLEQVDMVLATLGISLSAEKKAKAVVMLYRSFKAAGGAVDRDMIVQAVTLASG